MTLTPSRFTTLCAMLCTGVFTGWGQGVIKVPGSPGWTQQLLCESQESPTLTLMVTPSLAGAKIRKGFQLEVHQDNHLFETVLHRGKRPARFHLLSEHLYTLVVAHPAGFQKVIQFDTEGLEQHIQVDCQVDLFVRPNLNPLTFDDELVLSTPLSVVWYDAESNLFRHDPHLHHGGIEQLRAHLNSRVSSLHEPSD
ncbi:MAG: hypothetical protein ACPF8Y_06600 [Flavobacteriales bacterium]